MSAHREHGHKPHDRTSWVQRVAHTFAPHSHDHADSTDGALDRSGQGIRAVKISLIGLGITAVLQAVVVAVSGSVALLADTIHNLSDAFTAIPLWVAFVVGRRAATGRYTYGYGRAEDLAGLFIVAMIGLSAIVAAIQSIRRLADPVPLEHVGWVIVAGLLGFVGNELVAVYRIRIGRRIGSAALVADGMHARTDGLTSLAVVVGAIGVAAGVPLADPVVGLIITVAILFVLRSTGRDIWRRLMDGVDPDVVATAAATAATVSGVRAIDGVRLCWSGHHLRGDLTVSVDANLSVGAAHDIADAVENTLQRVVPSLADISVHVHAERVAMASTVTLLRSESANE